MHGTHAPRTARVAPLLQEQLGRLIVEEVKDPRVGFVTVTDVDVSPDLKQAKIFVSVMGDEARVADTLRGLKAAAAFLRQRLAAAVALRSVPALAFAHDRSLEQAARIAQLLAGAASGPAPPATATLPAPQTHRDLGLAAAGPPPADARRRPRRGAQRRRR